MIKQLTRFCRIILSIYLCIFILCSVSCAKNEKKVLHTINGGGVILTFDDKYVLEWYKAEKTLSKYNWKATFFLSHFSSLNEEDIKRLRFLQSKGHEIASHSEKHLNAKEFISTHSIDEYLRTEILPSINAMTKKGFEVKSFAYPYGKRNKKLDRILLKYFEMLRGTTYGKKDPSQHNNFANGSRVVFGLGIDDSYGNDIKYILEMLEYAKESNKIAIFYGHHITQENTLPEYTTSYRLLDTICQYVIANNMHFMTMKNLIIDQLEGG